MKNEEMQKFWQRVKSNILNFFEKKNPYLKKKMEFVKCINITVIARLK